MPLEKAVAITGWTSAEDLKYLASVAKKSYHIAEIGSWQGRSTYQLATNTFGEVYAIDTWKGSSEHQGMLHEKDSDWLINEFRKNIGGLPVTEFQMSSIDAANLFKKELMKFDLIFIDASHDYENVKADINAWFPLLKENGIICGHDYDPGWPGVIKAVNELIPKFKVPENTTIWTTEV